MALSESPWFPDAGHGMVRVREVHKLHGSQFRGLVNTVTQCEPVQPGSKPTISCLLCTINIYILIHEIAIHGLKLILASCLLYCGNLSGT